MINYAISRNSITVVINAKSTTLCSDHSQFNKIVALLKGDEFGHIDEQEIAVLLDMKSALTRYSDGELTIEGDVVCRKGSRLDDALARRVIKYWKSNVPYAYLLRFFDRVEENSSNASKTQLFSFLDHLGIPITEDGYILAYKYIDRDWYSVHGGDNSKVTKGTFNEGGHIFNGIGEEIRVKRNYVEDNPDVACSTGLHVGTERYAVGNKPTDGHVILVRINPADVVSVPRDCNGEKMRVSGYTVLAEYVKTMPEAVSNGPYDDATNENEDFDDEDIDEFLDEDNIRIRLS